MLVDFYAHAFEKVVEQKIVQDCFVYLQTLLTHEVAVCYLVSTHCDLVHLSAHVNVINFVVKVSLVAEVN